MSKQRVISFGIIPVLADEPEMHFLLIHMYGSGGGTHWIFPKGHQEIGESPLDTALREMHEEVGLVPHTVIKNQSFVSEYTFERNAQHIEKTSTYFIGFVSETDYVLQETEVKEARWCTKEEALALITFPSDRAMFERALSNLATQKLDNI